MNRAQEIAWAAGLFEGEGTWIVRPPKKEGARPTAVISLQMRDRDAVERFERIVACGKTIRVARSARNPAHSDMWLWTVANRADVKRVATMLLPYLCERRAERGKEVLAAASQADGRSRALSQRWAHLR